MVGTKVVKKPWKMTLIRNKLQEKELIPNKQKNKNKQAHR